MKNKSFTLIELLVACHAKSGVCICKQRRSTIRFTLIELLACQAVARRAKASLMRGFTLIELLVVIAIIGILASILMPALKSARDKAYSIQCINQLKQMGVATFSYIQDNSEFIPCSRASGATDHNYTAYHVQLYPYVKSGPYTNDYIRGNNIFRCPSDNDAHDEFGWLTSYGANIRVFFYASPTTVDAQPFGFSTIKKSSQLIGIMDTEDSLISDPCGTDAWYSGGFFNADPRHQSGTNILYMDGHGGWRKLPMQPAKNEPFSWCRTGERYN